MAAGDNWFTCNNQPGLNNALRAMVRNDGTGKPVISLNPATTLQPWFNCDNQNTTLYQLAQQLIVQDAQGKPAWYTTNL